MPQFHTIVLPTRPQVDTIAAIFLLKTFGREQFPGIENAKIEVWTLMPEGETEETLAAHGVALLDLGRGRFDHHGKEQITAVQLVARYLEIEKDPALVKLIEFIKRDDFYGKGIISKDTLDRAFGLPGLVSNLNKKYVKEPNKVVEIVLPLYEAHYEEEKQRTEGLPKELEELTQAGKVKSFTVRQNDKNLRVVSLPCDHPSMPGYLRSQFGGRHDVVAQWRATGHVNILTRPVKRVNLEALAALIRLEEATKSGKELELTESELRAKGRVNDVPEWYYDTATNSILNGGTNSTDVPATKLTREELDALLEKGLSGKIWD